MASASTDQPRLTPVQKFGEGIADRVERWMPSPFLFAIILTYVAALTAFLSQGSGLTEITAAWYGGFWSLLQFGMQMVLILVTASVVAYHPRVKGMITRLVRLPKSGRQAVLLVAVGSARSVFGSRHTRPRTAVSRCRPPAASGRCFS